MYLLNQFAQKNKEDTKSKLLKSGAILAGTGATVSALPSAALIASTNDKISRSKKMVPLYQQLDDIYKGELKDNHPDRFQDPIKKAEAQKKFQEINNERQAAAKNLDNAKVWAKSEKGLKNKVKGYKNKLSQRVSESVDDVFANKGIKPDKQMLGNAVKNAKNIYKKSALMSVGLGLGTAALTGAYLNRKRQQRKDKGILRGKYKR